MNKLEHGAPINATATHATAAVASVAGAAGKTHYITNVAASSDKSGSIMLVKQGTTTLWQVQVGVGSFSQAFSPALAAVSGALVSVEIDGTSACKANINGFTLQP